MRFSTRPRTLLPLAALLLLLSTGCQAAFKRAATQAPHAAVPALVDESLKAGEDAPTRQRVVAILGTPEMKEAIAEVARAAVVAALAEGSSEASQERIAELTKTVAGALAQSIASDIVPAVVAGTREALRENLSGKDMTVLQGALRSLAATSTTAAMRAAAREIPTTVGPAVRVSLARELEDPELHEAVSGLVGDAARQALTSTNDAVIEYRQKNVAEGRVGIIDRAGRMLTLSWGLVLAFGVGAAGLLAWVLRMRRRTKRYRGALLELMTKPAPAPAKDGEQDAGEPEQARMQRLFELLQ